MLNGTESIGDSSHDESSYSIFFATYNPDSPGYSNNYTEFGVQIALLKFCLQGIGITSMGILGILGNIASIIVLSSRRMRNSSSCFLLCLAMCDMIVLIGATLLIGIPSLLAYDPGSNVKFKFNERIVNFGNGLPAIVLYALAVTALPGSIFFTMALTLERYLAVCRPLSARFLCTWNRAVIMSVLIIIFTILYNLPHWWELEYVEEVIQNLTVIRPIPTELRMNKTYNVYYVHLSYVILCFLLPVIFLIVFNILIYRGIRAANKMRSVLSPSQKNENSLTKMLFGVVAVFLLCHLTPVLLAIYRIARGITEYVPELEYIMVFMIILNSSVNFLIYCASGGKFRDVFCDMFCFWRGKRKMSGASVKTTTRTLSSSSQFRNRAYSTPGGWPAIREDSLKLNTSPFPEVEMIRLDENDVKIKFQV